MLDFPAGRSLSAGTNLAGEVGSTTLRDLKDDGGLGVASGLKGGDGGGGRRDVLVHCQDASGRSIRSDCTHNGGDGELVLASVLEELYQPKCQHSAQPRNVRSDHKPS